MLISAYPRFHHDHGHTFNVLFLAIITNIVGFLIWFRILNENVVFLPPPFLIKQNKTKKGL